MPNCINDKKIFWIGTLLIAFSGGSWVFTILSNHSLLAGDFGQWLMFARYYGGDSYPNYLDPRSVHPLLPIFLSVVVTLVKDPFLALALAASILFSLLIASTAWVVYVLSNDIFSGLYTAILVTFGQYMLPIMTTGLLPQLGALVGINLTICALVMLHKKPGRNRTWILLFIGTGLAVFFHFPTAPIVLFITVFFVVYRLWHSKTIWNHWLKALIVIAVPFIFWAIYLFIFRDVTIEYVINRSAYYRLAPPIILDPLKKNPAIGMFIVLGVLSLLWLSVQSIQNRDNSLTNLILFWFCLPIIFMVVSYCFRIGTDYSRFVYYFIPPLISAISMTLTNLSTYLAKAHKYRMHAQETILTLILFAFVSISALSMQFSVDSYYQVADDLSLTYGESFREALAWLKDQPYSGTIFAPSRPEATWIEGLTGKSSLFPEEFRFIYRPGMMDRALNAHQIVTGTPLVADNGYIRAYFQEPNEYTHWHPYITFYDHGEYAELMTIQDQLVWLTIVKGGTEHLLSLSQDFDIVKSSIKEESGYQVSYEYQSAIYPVTLVKTVFLSADKPAIRVHYDIYLGQFIQGKELRFQFGESDNYSLEEVVRGTQIKDVLFTNSIISLVRKSYDGLEFMAQLNLAPNPNHVEITERESTKDVFLEVVYNLDDSDSSSVTFQLETGVGERHQGTYGITTLQEIVERYNIKFFLFRNVNVQARILMENHQYTPEYVNPNYIIYESSIKDDAARFINGSNRMRSFR